MLTHSHTSAELCMLVWAWHRQLMHQGEQARPVRTAIRLHLLHINATCQQVCCDEHT